MITGSRNIFDSNGKLGKLALIDRLITDIGCMSPVEYLPDGPIRSKVVVNDVEFPVPGTDAPEYIKIRKNTKDLDFNVRIRLMTSLQNNAEMERNSFKLYKPFLYPSVETVRTEGFDNLDPYVYVLPERNDTILNDDGEYENVVVNGYYYHQSKRIEPAEYSGLLFRVFNVGLGNEFSDPMKFFVDTYMIQQQSFVEVHLDDGFQQIVNLDREGLFEGSNVYRYLKNYLVHYIRGEAPPKPTKVINEDKKSIIEVQFKKEQEKLFPENRKDSIVSKIKKRRTQFRANKITERTEGLKQKILDDYGVEDMKIKRVRSITEVGLIQEKDVLVARIPVFTKRKELWELLCVGLLHNLGDNRDEKDKVISFIVDLYKEVEEGKLEETQ